MVHGCLSAVGPWLAGCEQAANIHAVVRDTSKAQNSLSALSRGDQIIYTFTAGSAASCASRTGYTTVVGVASARARGLHGHHICAILLHHSGWENSALQSFLVTRLEWHRSGILTPLPIGLRQRQSQWPRHVMELQGHSLKRDRPRAVLFALATPPWLGTPRFTLKSS